MSQNDAETPRNDVVHGIQYYAPGTLEILKRHLESVGASTWHKIMNPLCGECLIERGRALAAKLSEAVNVPNADR